MRALGTALLASVLVVALSGGYALKADADSNDKKIIGTWEVTKADNAPPGATVEFTKDGKIKLRAEFKGKSIAIDGTYKVEGSKIHTTLKFGGQERKETGTIKTLTDTKLVVEDPKGKVEEYKRKK